MGFCYVFFIRKWPSSNEDLLWQPLIWIFYYDRGILLRSRLRLHWVELENGITATVASWGNYVCHLRSSQLMFSFVGVLVLGNFLSNCSPSFVCVWFGYFIPFNVIIGVKGITRRLLLF